jgi:sulfite reductase (NADPH) flavoprotein alpha-component
MPRMIDPKVSLSTVLAAALASAGVCTVFCCESRCMMAGGVIVAYLAMCFAVFVARRGRARRIAGMPVSADADAAHTLVAYASQTGFGEQIALQTAQRLQSAGVAVRLESLESLNTLDALTRHPRALFIVSTTGEGDAPDSAAGFVRKLMSGDAGTGSPAMSGLRYGVLALGDRTYREYCAFGHALDGWLRERRAEPLFDPIEVDNGDANALHQWQTQLSLLAGGAIETSLPTTPYTRWLLSERTWLNPGSAGEPAFHVCLEPTALAALNWQAGDIAEIRPQHSQHVVRACLQAASLDGDALVECDGERITFAEAIATRTLPNTFDAWRGETPQALVDTLRPLASRQYSISSLPADGRLELLVRLSQHADPSADDGLGFGLASGWLTRHAAAGAPIGVRIRTNRSFHAPLDDRPLILIGAGTGLAGLRAHLKHRALRGHRRNWLIFGERSAGHDAFHADELAQWQASGVLQRLDTVWSRDGGERRYVHDAMRDAAAHLRQWVDDGAAIYLCGSVQRMARTVHAALVEILGEARVDALRESGRYRRDVY